jgi:protein gp37
MGENSKIEWTTHTFNPWFGCQKVSPGCDHCYAEAMMDHRYGKVQWGPHGNRIRTSQANWRLPIKWAKHANGSRPRVFCASLADWLDNRVPWHWRIDLAGLIDATPQLDWLLLTKRIENFTKLAPWHKAPANVWLGITCEDQHYYHKRWPLLRQIKAPIRFISYEPALGPLTLGPDPPDWVICGGESGTKSARYMEPSWAAKLLDECAGAGIAFFMKQMTGQRPIPCDLLVRQFPR